MSTGCLVGPDDPRFASRLDVLGPGRPSALHVRGRLPTFRQAVAVVGTRAADDDALAFAERLGRELAGAGAVVVSGGARGIDAAAHRGALAAGGPTVAVLAGGLDAPYPPEHAALFDAVAAAGALVSEEPDGTPPHPGRFLRRNRIVAALADAVVVVQAPVRSGALSTARWAQRLGRALHSVPHAPWDPRGEGCLRLLRDGARVCTGAGDVLQVAPPEARNPGLLPDSRPPVDRPPAERDVLAALHRGAAHVDDLVARTGLPAATVLQALVVLMLDGLAVDRGDGRWSQA